MTLPMWGEERETVEDHVTNGCYYTLGAAIAITTAGASAQTGNLFLAGMEAVASAGAISQAVKEFHAAYREYNKEQCGRDIDSDYSGSEGMACDRDSDLR